MSTEEQTKQTPKNQDESVATSTQPQEPANPNNHQADALRLQSETQQQQQSTIGTAAGRPIFVRQPGASTSTKSFVVGNKSFKNSIFPY